MRQNKIDEIIKHLWNHNNHPFIMKHKNKDFESFYDFFQSINSGIGFSCWPYEIIYQDINDSYVIEYSSNIMNFESYVDSEIFEIKKIVSEKMKCIFDRFINYCNPDEDSLAFSYVFKSEYLLSTKNCHNVSVYYSFHDFEDENSNNSNVSFNWYKPEHVVSFKCSLFIKNKEIITCNPDELSRDSLIFTRLNSDVLELINFKNIYDDSEILNLMNLNSMVIL